MTSYGGKEMKMCNNCGKCKKCIEIKQRIEKIDFQHNEAEKLNKILKKQLKKTK